MPQYLQPIPELVDDEGVPFATATKAVDGWVKSFAAIEGGTVTTAEQIVDIVLEEAAVNLAHQYSGLITDIMLRRPNQALHQDRTES